MTPFPRFMTIVLAVYSAYYLVVILLDKINDKQVSASTSTGRQHIDFTITHEPRRASLEDSSVNRVEEEVKKNFNEQQPYTATPDKISQESIGTDIKHDLGLEIVSVDGIEVTPNNIFNLIYNTVQ